MQDKPRKPRSDRGKKRKPDSGDIIVTIRLSPRNPDDNRAIQWGKQWIAEHGGNWKQYILLAILTANNQLPDAMQESSLTDLQESFAALYERFEEQLERLLQEGLVGKPAKKTGKGKDLNMSYLANLAQAMKRGNED